MSLFSFNKQDFKVAADELRKKPEHSKKTDQQLLRELPLSTWQGKVRRNYLDGEQQVQNLQGWFEKYEGSQGRDLASGRHVFGVGEQREEFENCLDNQMKLAAKERMSGK